MKKLSLFGIVILFITTILFSSFIKISDPIPNPPDEFETLVNYLEANNNFINGELPIISADEVKKNMKDPKFHLIDIRTDSWFEYAHIKGAANVKAENLLTYFETKINPTNFDKIVIMCYSGQSAAYFTSLLRLAGYDNVYSMKWGMSSWREDFANGAWNKNISNEFASKLETTPNAQPSKGSHPTLNTGKAEAKEILKARLTTLFKQPYSDLIVKSADVFESPANYFVINYNSSENYDFGHIPSAVRYEPNTSLTTSSDLYTIPVDKKVAVYETTGQKAAFVVAYLNLLGYEIGNVAYGENSFMNEVLIDQDRDAFTNKEINMYPVVE